MSREPIDQLCDSVRKCSYALHRYLRHGHLEKVYENGLCHRLQKSGLQVHQQVPVPVMDEDGALLGDFVADLVVENMLIIELKAVTEVHSNHIAQLLGYLLASRKPYELLVNFGAPRLYVKRFVMQRKLEEFSSGN